jgi:hypothetical protein
MNFLQSLNRLPRWRVGLTAVPPKTAACFLAWALSGTGCGGNGQGSVAGKVSFQNRPLSYGSVVLVGADGIPKTTSINPGGLYSFADLPCGEVKLAVHSPDPAGLEKLYKDEKIKMLKGVTPPPDRKLPEIDRAKWFPIPADFGDFNKSGLKITLGVGPNVFNIDLK